jgi:hypothetical protein
MKISHKELEACRFSPKSWVASKQAGGGFGRFGYKQALGFAICEFHRVGSVDAAVMKIDGYAAQNFKDLKKIAKLYESLDEYTKWFIGSGIVAADANVLLNYPYTGDWHLGGMVARVDIADPGYRAVLFETLTPNWKNQLRMPLIQLAIADRYGRPASEVRVGLQDLNGNACTDTYFGLSTRVAASAEFKKIGGQVLKFWPQSKP